MFLAGPQPGFAHICRALSYAAPSLLSTAPVLLADSTYWPDEAAGSHRSLGTVNPTPSAATIHPAVIQLISPCLEYLPLCGLGVAAFRPREAWRLHQWRRRLANVKATRCPGCAYDLRGCTESRR